MFEDIVSYYTLYHFRELFFIFSIALTLLDSILFEQHFDEEELITELGQEHQT